MFCPDADSSKCSLPPPPGPSYDLVLAWAAWLGRRAEGEWPRCSPAKFKEKGPLTLPARSSSQAGRADASAGRTQRPESELSGPAQLCSCLLCLAAEAVVERRREHTRLAQEVLSTASMWGLLCSLLLRNDWFWNIYNLHNCMFICTCLEAG